MGDDHPPGCYALASRTPDLVISHGGKAQSRERWGKSPGPDLQKSVGDGQVNPGHFQNGLRDRAWLRATTAQPAIGHVEPATSHGDIPRSGRRHLLTRDLNCCTHAAGRRRGGCHPPGALPLWALEAAGERQHEERSGGCERKPGELKRELISHKLVAARGINAGKRLPSATGRERHFLGFPLGSELCLSSSQQQNGASPGLALSQHLRRQNPRACLGLSGEHSRVLDPPQPAHAKPRICKTPACVQQRQQLDWDLFGQQRADQLCSWLLIRAGLGKQLAALPGTPEPDCQPKSITARQAPCSGISPCRAGAATLLRVHLSLQQDVEGRCSPFPITGMPSETGRSHSGARSFPRLFGSPSPARCRLRAAVAAAEVGAMMTQEIMRQIRRRRGAVRGRGEEAAVSFGPTPAPPDVAPQLRSRNTHPRPSDSPGGHGSTVVGR